MIITITHKVKGIVPPGEEVVECAFPDGGLAR